MENIDILIYSAPKTAGNTLEFNLTKSNYNVYYTHDSHFFSSSYPCQNNNISLNEYITNESASKKLVIIMIYREYVDRIISHFFQSFEYFYNVENCENINDIPTDELIDFFNKLVNLSLKKNNTYIFPIDKLNLKINKYIDY
jgi:hypothetical protein